MNNFNFGEVLTRAWQIIWKHKVLWIFGILASCGRGGNFNSNSSGSGGDSGDFGSTDLPPQFMQWAQWIEENMVQFVAILVAIVCVFWIIAIFLGTIGRIGLIRGASQAESGAEGLIFGQLFSESIPYFWRMFGLSLILGLPVFVVAIFTALFVIVGFGIGAAAGSGNEALPILTMTPLLIGCFCLLAPVMIVVGMIFRQSERAIVLEEMGVLPAITRGWDIFRANLGPIILMAIILGIIGIVAGFVIAIPIFIIVFPTMFAYIAGGESVAPLIFMGVCICLYIPVALVLQGAITAYTESAWTLTFLRLTRKSDTGAPMDNAPTGSEDPNQTLLAKPNA